MKGYELAANAALLRAYYPLDNLTEDDLSLLCERLTPESVAKGKVVVEFGTTDNQAIYLIRGLLSLTAIDGRTHIIEDGSAESFRPISHLDPHRYTIRAASNAEIFRVDNTIINNIVQYQLPSSTPLSASNPPISKHWWARVRSHHWQNFPLSKNSV